MLRKTSAIAASALVAASILAGAAPAAAETTPQSAPRAASVPGCVVTSLDDSGTTDYLTVYNDCGYDVRVKVVLAHATDLSCQTIFSGTHRNYQWVWPGRFDRLDAC
ncbi:hypothetical protein LG943_16415 [Streptomonospora sp. S1-112]|uniref:Uncharacterized protein n=1 Tax=Streptomonospora mangrovi TaxID=2883123 RepID=A0A9X3NQ37_9ACTN|nr:hypothetical protein [Streptomonospora mangrovi]MDA0565884.1 hypothetical protein [Streptomonospora mangrovi]